MPTLVIGAGASIDVHSAFKSGVQLIDKIIEMVEPGGTFSKRVCADMQIAEKDFNTIQNNIVMYKKNAGRPSIDEFLSEVKTFPEYENVKDAYIWIGKVSIIYNILLWEWSYVEAIRNGDLDYKETWINKIMPYLIGNKKMKTGSLNIVTFNYDRLIEYIATLNGYKDSGLFWERIIHVYGSIGLEKVPFGHIPQTFDKLTPHMGDFITIYDLRKIPKTLPRNSQQWSRMDKAASYIGVGKTYFTGFGFDYFNCRNLKLQDHESENFIGNVYVKEIPADFFKERRKETERIRTILPYMTFKYGKASEFIDYFLEDANAKN